MENRHYADRHQPLADLNFDPYLDLRIGASGAWEWARPRPELEAALMNYFVARAQTHNLSAGTAPWIGMRRSSPAGMCLRSPVAYRRFLPEFTAWPMQASAPAELEVATVNESIACFQRKTIAQLIRRTLHVIG